MVHFRAMVTIGHSDTDMKFYAGSPAHQSPWPYSHQKRPKHPWGQKAHRCLEN